MNKFFLAFVLCAINVNVYAQAISEGKIGQIYTNASGFLALRLDEPFSEASIQECPDNNGYAGLQSTADPILKSTLLAAFTSQKKVKLVINGCAGSWLNIVQVYVFAHD